MEKFGTRGMAAVICPDGEVEYRSEIEKFGTSLLKHRSLRRTMPGNFIVLLLRLVQFFHSIPA